MLAARALPDLGLAAFDDVEYFLNQERSYDGAPGAHFALMHLLGLGDPQQRLATSRRKDIAPRLLKLLADWAFRTKKHSVEAKYTTALCDLDAEVLAQIGAVYLRYRDF